MSGHYPREMGAEALAASLRLRSRFNAHRVERARQDALRAKARLLLNTSSLILCEETLQEGEIIVSPQLYAAVKVLIAEDEKAKQIAEATLAARERELGGDSGTAAREGLPSLQEGEAVPGQSAITRSEF